MKQKSILMGVLVLGTVVLAGYYFLILLPGHNQSMYALEQEKLEIQRLEIKLEQEKLDNEIVSAQVVEENKKIDRQQQIELALRSECEREHQKSLVDFEDFINTCSQYNSQDYCLNSEAGELYSDYFASYSVRSCVDRKKNEL